VAVSNQSIEDIDAEVNGTAMPRMLDLRNVFELVDNRLDDDNVLELLFCL
jgi:hypothetical protein